MLVDEEIRNEAVRAVQKYHLPQPCPLRIHWPISIQLLRELVLLSTSTMIAPATWDLWRRPLLFEQLFPCRNSIVPAILGSGDVERSDVEEKSDRRRIQRLKKSRIGAWKLEQATIKTEFEDLGVTFNYYNIEVIIGRGSLMQPDDVAEVKLTKLFLDDHDDDDKHI